MMQPLLRALLPLIVVVALATSHRSARADEPSQADLDRAATLYQEGELHFKVSEYDQAIDKFKEAYKLSHQPLLLYNLAQVYRARHECRVALRHYRQYLRDAPDAYNREIVEGHITEMEACAKTEAPAPDQPPPDETPTDPVADPVRPDPTKQPPDDRQPVRRGGTARLIGMIGVGTGLALVGTGGYFSYVGADKANELETRCASLCNFDNADIAQLDKDGKAADRNAVILYAAGGVAIVGGVAVYLLLGTPGSPDATRVGLAPTAGGGLVTWTGAF